MNRRTIPIMIAIVTAVAATPSEINVGIHSPPNPAVRLRSVPQIHTATRIPPVSKAQSTKATIARIIAAIATIELPMPSATRGSASRYKKDRKDTSLHAVGALEARRCDSATFFGAPRRFVGEMCVLYGLDSEEVIHGCSLRRQGGETVNLCFVVMLRPVCRHLIDRSFRSGISREGAGQHGVVSV